MAGYAYTAWVCGDCMLHHASGGCGNCHRGAEGADVHDRVPWNFVTDERITMGMLYSEHDESCGLRNMAGPNVCTPTSACACEIREFSRYPCDGCESPLAGARFAFTLWGDNPEN